MKIVFLLFLANLIGVAAYGQVSTQTELSTNKQAEIGRPGYFFYAKPFEVTMTVNLWGEVPQQGVYVVPTNTDIIQLISFAGGPKERSDLDEVLIYRVATKKDQKARSLLKIDVRDILEGRSQTTPLTPGDMIVVKTLTGSMTLQEVLAIVSAAGTLTILGLTIYNMKK